MDGVDELRQRERGQRLGDAPHVLVQLLHVAAGPIDEVGHAARHVQAVPLHAQKPHVTLAQAPDAGQVEGVEGGLLGPAGLALGGRVLLLAGPL